MGKLADRDKSGQEIQASENDPAVPRHDMPPERHPLCNKRLPRSNPGLSGQSLISQPPPVGVLQDMKEPTAVAIPVLALVETERLLIKVAEQVERPDERVGPLQRPLQEAPVVLQPVRVDLPLHVCFSMVNDLVQVFAVQTFV